MSRKPRILDMSDDPLDDPESNYEEHQSLDFNDTTNREEGKIFEEFEEELEAVDLDEVFRELPDLTPEDVGT